MRKLLSSIASAIANTRTEQSMLVFIAADTLMFGAFFLVYLYLRRLIPVWPTAFHFPSSLMAVTMTMFAIAASFLAGVAARQTDALIATRCLAASVVVWLSFVFVEAVEWARLFLGEGVTLRSNHWNVPLFGFSYYTLSGLHLLHVLAAIVYLTIAAARIRKYDKGACALYSYFVTLMWLVLYPALYLTAADLKGL